jgi:GxxExxY protein
MREIAPTITIHSIDRTNEAQNVTELVKDATENDLTYRIIGAAMAVHNDMGSGYKEEVYEKALAAELAQRDIPVERQYAVEVQYQGLPVALFYLDLFVAGTVVVEVKAFPHQLTDDEIAQVINYLKATGSPVGLLFNFGRRSLQYRRVFPPRAVSEVQRLGRDNVKKGR